jgi:hypothetical protein
MDEHAQEPQENSSRPWLKEFQYRPGQSGNPSGRPKGRTLTARLRRRLDEASPAGAPFADLVIQVLVDLALGGDRLAIKDIFERVEGRMPVVVTTTHDDAYAGAAEIIRERRAEHGPG